MIREEIKNKVEEFAKEKYSQINLEDKRLCTFEHAKIVRDIALDLAKKEKLNDFEVIEISSLLHDIGRCIDHKNHPQLSSKLSEEFLKTLNLPEIKINLILECISKHGKENVSKDNPLEVKIIQSADALSIFHEKSFAKIKMAEEGKDYFLNKYKKKSIKITLDSAKEIAEEKIKEFMNEQKNQELEIKILEIDEEAFRNKLKTNNAKLIKKVYQKNFIYKNDHVDKNQILVRVRDEGDDVYITVKNNGSYKNGMKCREELEFNIKDEFKIKRMLELMGFEKKKCYEYKREYYELNECIVEIIKAPNIPTFLEIEGEELKILETSKLLGYNKSDYFEGKINEKYPQFNQDLKFED